MSKQMMWVAGAVVILLIGGFLFMQMNQSTQTTETPTTQTPQATITSESSPATTSGETTGTVKKFTVAGSNFKFEPSTMVVNQGDTVEITFTSSGIHDLVIDEFNARTAQIGSGDTETLTFVADKKGSFEYYCSVGNHRANGMTGTLTVN